MAFNGATDDAPIVLSLAEEEGLTKACADTRRDRQVITANRIRCVMAVSSSAVTVVWLNAAAVECCCHSVATSFATRVLLLESEVAYSLKVHLLRSEIPSNY